MQIGPQCSFVAGGRQLSVAGPFNPWQNDFVTVTQGGLGGQDAPPITVFGQSDGLSGLPNTGGDRLLRSAPFSRVGWIELDIRPQGTLIFRTGDPVPRPSQISSGFASSPARARVYWPDAGTSVVQFVDVDIGTGVNFSIPPTTEVLADLLVPNPETNDVPRVPAGFDRDAFQFATTVTARLVCVSAPGDTRPTLTRCVFLPLVLESFTGQQVSLPRGARSVQILAEPPQGAVPPPVLGDVIAEFTEEYATFGPGVAPTAPFNSTIRQRIPFTTPFGSERVVVPGGASSIRVRLSGTANTGSNVCVITELGL